MEQIRKLLTWLKKYHFWVLSVVIVAVGLVCWYSSAGALAKQFKEHQGKIQGAFTTRDKIQNDTFHPNQEIIDKQLAEIQKRGAAVIATWQQLYDRQRAEVLKWPTELGKDFCDPVEKLKFGDEIPKNLCDLYRDYIETHFPQLPKIIQARIIEGGGGGRSSFLGSAGAGMSRESLPTRDMPSRTGSRTDATGQGVAEPVEEEFVCVWLDQQSVRDQLHFEQRPSALKVWVTQENLWAYHTLLDVIAATNESVKADRQSNAAVREIQSLEVGQPAAEASRTPDRISLADAARAPAAGAATGLEAAPTTAGQARPSARDDSIQADSPEQEAAKLLSGRYVDSNGKPIPFTGPAAGLRTALEQEYKRLPVRLVIRMDWRSLSYLIAECANQPLQIEVQEVRINPADGGAGSSQFGSRSSRETGSFRTGFGTSSGGIETFPANENLVQVVIQGVIYIFNEPDKSLLPAADAAAAN